MKISSITCAIITFFLNIIEIIIPKNQKTLFLEKISENEWKKMFHIREHEGVTYFFSYQEINIRQAIWEIKYHRNKTIKEALLKIVSGYILEELADLELFENFKNPVLSSIPSSMKRKSIRGGNQSEDISKFLSKSLDIPFEKYLLKSKNTPPQTTLKRNARLHNLTGSFLPRLKYFEKIKGGNIILFDDVTTTGATLKEAKKVLLKAGARKVLCYALAH